LRKTLPMTDTEGEAEMAEQQVPNLEEMDQQEAQHFLDELFSRLNAEAEYQILCDALLWQR
jgi:hypothetical protein